MSLISENRPRIDSIFLGSIVCIALLVAFTFLGLGLGFSFENAGVSVVIFNTIGVLASFLIGGMITALLNSAMSRGSRVISGLCMWALASLMLIYIASTVAGSAFRFALNSMGLGVVSAVGMQTMANQLNDLNPRMETDIKLTEGKAVTTLKMGKPEDKPIEAAEKAAKQQVKEIEKVAQPTDEMKDKIKATTSLIGWGLFGFFFSSLCASLGGIFLGSHHRGRLVHGPV